MPRAVPPVGSRASRWRMPTATFDLPMSTTFTWRSTPPPGAFLTARYSSAVTSVAVVTWPAAGAAASAAPANPSAHPSRTLRMSDPQSRTSGRHASSQLSGASAGR